MAIHGATTKDPLWAVFLVQQDCTAISGEFPGLRALTISLVSEYFFWMFAWVSPQPPSVSNNFFWVPLTDFPLCECDVEHHSCVSTCSNKSPTGEMNLQCCDKRYYSADWFGDCPCSSLVSVVWFGIAMKQSLCLSLLQISICNSTTWHLIAKHLC